MAPLKHPLQKPVELKSKDTGEVVQRYDELTFRDPTGGDILAIGNPVIFDMASNPPKVTHDEPKMSAMIARLANVPPLAVNSLGPQDWVECAWLLTPFFVPRAGTV